MLNINQHIFTRKFNQDPLESSFAQVRMGCSHNRNPSAFEFNYTIVKFMSIKILPNLNNSSNCELDIFNQIELCDDVDMEALNCNVETINEINEIIDLDEPSVTNKQYNLSIDFGDLDDIEEYELIGKKMQQFLESCSRRYFAGLMEVLNNLQHKFSTIYLKYNFLDILD